MMTMMAMMMIIIIIQKTSHALALQGLVWMSLTFGKACQIVNIILYTWMNCKGIHIRCEGLEVEIYGTLSTYK